MMSLAREFGVCGGKEGGMKSFKRRGGGAELD